MPRIPARQRWEDRQQRPEYSDAASARPAADFLATDRPHRRGRRPSRRAPGEAATDQANTGCFSTGGHSSHAASPDDEHREGHETSYGGAKPPTADEGLSAGEPRKPDVVALQAKLQALTKQANDGKPGSLELFGNSSPSTARLSNTLAI